MKELPIVVGNQKLAVKKIFLIVIIALVSSITYSQDYTSSIDGSWDDPRTWGNTFFSFDVPGTFGIVDGESIEIASSTTVNALGLVLSLNNLTIDVYGTLEIDAGFALNNVTLNIHSGGELIITPAADIDGIPEVSSWAGTIINNDGYVSIDPGDLYNDATSEINNTGTILIPNGVLISDGEIDNEGNITTEDNAIGGSGTYEDHSGIGTLPIELVYFKVNPSQNKVAINWQTATEENNDYFSIERSINGIDFEEIGYISGAGNSSTLLDYSYTDFNPVFGISYYRLKQTDYDGDFVIFEVESINFSYNEINTPTVHLIMTNHEITIELNSNINLVNVEIIDISGRLISSKRYQSVSKMQIQTNEIPGGIYLVRISNNTGLNLTEKVQIQ